MKCKMFPPGQQCFGDIRLLPIDVGHDLRLQKTRIRLPESLDGKTVGAEMRDGTPCLVSGTRDEILKFLRGEGYRVI